MLGNKKVNADPLINQIIEWEADFHLLRNVEDGSSSSEKKYLALDRFVQISF